MNCFRVAAHTYLMMLNEHRIYVITIPYAQLTSKLHTYAKISFWQIFFALMFLNLLKFPHKANCAVCETLYNLL